MYDLSSKFNTFYNDYVILSQEEKSNLYDKKELNIQRLKDGLKEYNEENNTSYSIKKTYVQGSVAMSTVVQNEDNDYDIDVAIVFDKSELGDKGAQATRNMVADAFKRKMKQFFNAEPEVKTSCVRVKYVDGYHVDFAIYRREYDECNDSWVYEHAGADWTKRELNGLSKWFITKNRDSGENLTKIVRLSKMFCKSRKFWKNMPSGLLQTILCEEKLENSYERIDELFYYTMKAIVERLEVNTCVAAPVDNGRALTTRKSDIQRMTYWKNRLKSKLEDLEILFKDNCSRDDAIQAWYGFFNHDYWRDQSTKIAIYESKKAFRPICSFDDTEEYIEELYQLKLLYSCEVSCIVSLKGFRPKRLNDFLSIQQPYLPHNFKICCTMDYTDCPQPYKIFWKVKNVGPESERRDQIRGQIIENGKRIVEHSTFYGNHYIECYIIKNNMCVAKKRINIPIDGG